MGASCEANYGYGKDVREVFDRLQADSRYEFGHGPYSGTISEAQGYVVYTKTPLLLDEADKLAWRLANDEAEKWGPALAVPFVDTEREVKVVVPEYLHPTDQTKVQDTLIEIATAAVRKARLLRRGEKVVRGSITSYTEPNRSGYSGANYSRPLYVKRLQVHMNVRIKRAASALTPEKVATMEPDGWCFGGCYSS